MTKQVLRNKHYRITRAKFGSIVLRQDMGIAGGSWRIGVYSSFPKIVKIGGPQWMILSIETPEMVITRNLGIPHIGFWVLGLGFGVGFWG